MVFSGSYGNSTDSHDITEILLKVALNTITITHINKNRIDIKYITIFDNYPNIK